MNFFDGMIECLEQMKNMDISQISQSNNVFASAAYFGFISEHENKEEEDNY